MKASLLVRAAPVLLIAGVLAGGPALAQTGASTTAPATTGAPTPMENHGGSMAAPSTTGSAGHAGTLPENHTATGAAGQTGTAMRESVEQRITDLHAKLHITAAQGKHWNAFAQVMRSNERSMDQAYRERAQHLGSMSALQDLESYARLERARSQDVERLVPVFRALYDSMSAQQKKTADQLFRTYASQHDQPGKASSR